jgi:hypothetical protein
LSFTEKQLHIEECSRVSPFGLLCLINSVIGNIRDTNVETVMCANPINDVKEMQFGFDRNGEVFCAGWVVEEWNSLKEFKYDNKPFKVEVVKAGSPRCEELMSYFLGQRNVKP